MKKYTDFVKEEKEFKPKSRKQTFHLGTEITGVEVELISDVYGSEISDTEVTVSAGTICVISGDTIYDFQKELQEVIDKYKIWKIGKLNEGSYKYIWRIIGKKWGAANYKKRFYNEYSDRTDENIKKNDKWVNSKWSISNC